MSEIFNSCRGVSVQVENFFFSMSRFFLSQVEIFVHVEVFQVDKSSSLMSV